LHVLEGVKLIKHVDSEVVEEGIGVDRLEKIKRMISLLSNQSRYSFDPALQCVILPEYNITIRRDLDMTTGKYKV